MSDSWNDRKRSLEEEYFRRKEQEAIEKLRAERAAREQGEQPQAPAPGCPKCEGSLVELDYEGVQVDRCDKCNGVWLDAGELERLTHHEEAAGWLKRLLKNVSGS